jgi:FlaG/FlaF family flagellin (archaellin)
MVALVVILAAVISTFSLGFVDGLRDPGPNTTQSSGEFTPQDGNDGGIVLLTHEAGDSVRIKELEIAVQAECTGGIKQGRIVNLPAGAGNAIRASDGQINRNNIFDERSLKTIDNVVSQIND